MTKKVLLAMAVLAACSSHTSKPPTTAPASAAGSAPAASSNLVATPEVKAQLLAAYTSQANPGHHATGPVKGTTYYAYLAPTKTWWAFAHFTLAPGASTDDGVSMQDGGDIGIFHHTAGQPWQASTGGEPFPCPGSFPAQLLPIWHLTYAQQACELVSDRSATAGQTTTVALGDSVPDGTFFGRITSYDVKLDRSGFLDLEGQALTAAGAVSDPEPLDVVSPSLSPKATTSWTDAGGAHPGVVDQAFAQRMTAGFKDPGTHWVVTVQGHQVVKIVEISDLAQLHGQAFAETGPLDEADWPDVTVPGSTCGVAQPITLHRGSATFPGPGANGQVGLDEGPIKFGELTAPSGRLAAVYLECALPNSSVSGVLETSWVVFSGTSNHPEVVGVITPQQPQAQRAGLHVPTLTTALSFLGTAITVHEGWYVQADGECCPSISATTQWEIDTTGKLVPVRTTHS